MQNLAWILEGLNRWNIHSEEITCAVDQHCSQTSPRNDPPAAYLVISHFFSPLVEALQVATDAPAGFEPKFPKWSGRVRETLACSRSQHAAGFLKSRVGELCGQSVALGHGVCQSPAVAAPGLGRAICDGTCC